jgi:hypothetical protein
MCVEMLLLACKYNVQSTKSSTIKDAQHAVHCGGLSPLKRYECVTSLCHRRSLRVRFHPLQAHCILTAKDYDAWFEVAYLWRCVPYCSPLALQISVDARVKSLQGTGDFAAVKLGAAFAAASAAKLPFNPKWFGNHIKASVDRYNGWRD